MPLLLSALLAFQQGIASPAADAAPPGHTGAGAAATAAAARVRRAPSIDGRLDDGAWREAIVIDHFVQSNPREGEPATERTEVRITYDDAALYVAARMYERDPSRVRGLLTRRDGSAPTDLFTLALDTYHDHQTAMVFSVNPLGVRSDRLLSGDQSSGDDSWDPVWEAAARVDSLGWTAELRIPLSQLRFAPRHVQQWGVNVFRYAAARNETDAFVLVRQSEQGFASRFAHLDGIVAVPAPKRLELLPYARTQVESRRATAGDPFFDGRRTTPGAGLDLKYGITSNLTLDATVNPDFGQVEADPAQLNLTVFETQFQERRPFFVEGSQIFAFGSGGGYQALPGQIFYSRRVGRAPTLAPDLAEAYSGGDSVIGPFTDAPASTPILGAAKVSGRLARGTSVGFLHAETGRVIGDVAAEQLFGHWTYPPAGDSVFVVDDRRRVRYRDPIEPRAHYTVGRLKQDFRGGQTSVGLLAANVARDLGTPRLDSLFRRNAQTVGFDWMHRWSRNRFAFNGTTVASRIAGSPTAIAAAQRSSARYFQRPGQDYVTYDPTRTSLSGYSSTAKLRYAGTSGFGGSVIGGWTSPGYELNDAGFLGRADQRELTGFASYGTPRPTRHFRRVAVEGSMINRWDFGWERTGRSVGLNVVAQLQNGWGVFGSVSRGSRAYNYTATRGGPALASTANKQGSISINSDDRKAVSASLNAYGYGTDYGTMVRGGAIELTWRPALNATLSVAPLYDFTRERGYLVRSVSDTLATATYGRRYVFSNLEQRTLSVATRASVTFTPSLSFQLYVEPFVSGARVDNFREMMRAKDSAAYYYSDPAIASVTRDTTGSYTITRYENGVAVKTFVITNPDARLRSLRGNAVLRWEYRPGATLFAVWSHDRSAFDRAGSYTATPDALGSLFGLPPQNVFLLKANLWISR